MKGEGEGNEGTAVSSSPLPLPLQPFFCFRSNFRAITRLETLATGYPSVGPHPRVTNFLASLGAQVQPDIAHPCHQLTAVKTGYPLTSQAQVHFFKKKMHRRYVVFMSCTITV